jgi:hypothetical protein
MTTFAGGAPEPAGRLPGGARSGPSGIEVRVLEAQIRHRRIAPAALYFSNPMPV